MRVTKPRDDEPIRLITTSSGAPRYRVVLDVAPKGAPRRSQVTRTFGDLRSARDFVAQTRAGLSTGTYTPPSSETLDQACERWLATRRDIRPVTQQSYAGWLSPVRRYLGQRKVQAVTVVDVEALIDWMIEQGGVRGQALGPRSVKAALVGLGQVLAMCEREGTVTRNVARLARRPRVRKIAGTDLEHWQPDELVRFVKAADADPLAGAWRLTACGMTRADVCGLRWSDVDMTTGVVTISQGRVALERGDHTDDPKSAARRRALPVEQMWPGTVDALRSLRASQARDRLAAGPAYVDTGLVVVDALGQGVSPQWYSDRFRVVCQDGGLPPITLHSVRHSLAFWLHREGVSPADAAALLGHTVEVHLSTYLPHSGTSGIASAASVMAASVGVR